MNQDLSLHLHRFAVECPLPLPADSSTRTSSIELPRDRLFIELRNSNELPSQLSRLQAKPFYDLGDSALLWINGFGMQLDWASQNLGLYLPPEGDYWPKAVKTVLNVGLAAATFLRGELPFHAGAASLDGQFFGILAPSGTGKSTMLWALVQAGALFGNDDLLTVRISTESINNLPLGMPSVSLYPKLCAPSLEMCGDQSIACETFPNSNEYWMHIVPSQRLLEAESLRCFFLLEPDESATKVTSRQWHEGEAAFTLAHHLHAVQFGRAFVGPKKLEGLLLKIAVTIPIYVLNYPKRYDQIPAVIETIRKLLALLPNSLHYKR